jgi:hypothetical protein
MKIDCLGTVGIIHTEKKSYWYNRKVFNIGKRYVKAKKIRKYKTVLIKEPYLCGDIQLRVDADFILGGVYVDDNGKKYMCVQKLLMPTPISTLRRVTMNLGKTFSAPKMLTHIMASVSEMSTGSADR